jgi:predicted DNA binding CopG/RHH family protein
VFLHVSFQNRHPNHPFLESVQQLHGKFLTLAVLLRDMLLAMQQPNATRASSDRSSSPGRESAPSLSPASFAGILEALAAPAQPPPEQPFKELDWNNDDLADDVATLSYENALKTHARYRATDQSLTQPADKEPFSYEEASSDASAAAPYPDISSREPKANTDQEPSLYRASSYERNLKDASITIRMSKAECAQLHKRAAEAGLTISAYLRSCTFEAESLRAMVKDTLAQLHPVTAKLNPVTAQAKPVDSAPSRFRSLVRWLARLFNPWHGSQRVASA